MSELSFTDGDARACADACQRYVDGLKDVIQLVRGPAWVDGFGTFPSGQALAKKYGELANGETGSLRSVLEQHITVAENLRDAFLAAGAGYRTTEDDTVEMLNQSAQPR